MTDHYAVMGSPVAHSKSPLIHRLFAEQTGQDLDYGAIRVEPEQFPAAVADFLARGGKGLNITVPLKEAAWALATAHSDRAARAGAVNTLLLNPSGEHFGDNTDGLGLVRDLEQNHGIGIGHQRLLLVGAGGAARGVLEPLLRKQPARLVIANRTPAKAIELARKFSTLGRVEGCGFAELEGQSFDLVINATAAGLQGTVPALPADIIQPGTCCYDMMYGDEPTAFVRWAREGGAAQAVDGLGMLVEQAAESFFLWRKVTPDTGPVIRALRNQAG